MARKKKKDTTMLWYCPHCEKPFKTDGVAFTLTVKCPHCNKLQNIRELHAAGRKLVYAGLAAWSRLISLTDDIDHEYHGDVEFIVEFGTLKRIMRAIINQLAQDVEVLHYDEMHKDYVEEEREQEVFFEKNPGATIPKGKVTPL